MNTVQVTLNVYYKIVGADLYGGPESTGYAMMNVDFDKENLKDMDFQKRDEQGLEENGIFFRCRRSGK